MTYKVCYWDSVTQSQQERDCTPEEIAEIDARKVVDLPAAKAALLKQIDADTDAIYGAVLGNRGEEYTRAASDAQAYKDAGYTGTVPSTVLSWATAKSWTPTQAADDIMLVAAQWVGAQSAIRANRLLRKEQVRAATDLAPVAAGWSAFVVAIRAALGVA